MGNVTAKTSGEIASFMSPSMTNIKSLKVHFSPKQLGTGNPSPENVREIVGWDGVEVNGSGRNLASVQYGYDSYGGNPTSTVIQYRSKSTNEYVSSLINIKPNTTYTISREFIGGIFRYYFYSEYPILDITYSIDGSSGNANKYSFTFTTPSNAKYLFVVWTRTNSTSPCGKVQIELGSSPTSYEPYQGTTIPIDFTNNYLNKVQITNNKTINSTGEEITESGMSMTDYIPVNENEKWILSFISTTAGRTRRIWGYDENKQPISEFAKVSWATVNQEYILTATITSDIKYIRVCYYTNDTDLLLTIDGTSFKNVYGGYVDLISGELVEEWVGAKKKLSEANNKTLNSNGVIAYTFNFAIPYGQIINKNSQKCNICKYNWNMADVKTNHFFGYYNASTGNRFLLFLLEDNGLSDDTEVDFVAPLTTPITHQLTPTQLQSFVGQNNFWSNADYVEIEYDLIETEDIQKCKKKIILNQPQLKTISDKIVSFNTDMVAPLKNCKIYFKPIQLGSGDPSPTNVRNINGWTNIDSYVNGNKISVDWTSEAGTVYGGYLDLAKGEVVANMTVVEFDGSSDENWQVETLSSGLTNYYMYATSLIPKARGNQRTDGYICSNMCIPRGVDETYTSGMFYFSNSGALNVYLGGKSNTTTVAEFKSWLTEHKLQIAYWLETPIHYPLSSLTSQQLLTIKSTNHIWSETNGQQIDVKYWSHKNLTPTPLTDYLENQTWTDSAYISSSGKKTTGGTSASHFLTNQILLEAGTYVLSGFSYYVGTDNTNYRIHAYDSTGKWLRQIAYKQIGNLSPVDISFILDTDTYVNVSIAMDFDGVLTKIN